MCLYTKNVYEFVLINIISVTPIKYVFFVLESTCLMRQCCGPARALNLHITDNNNQVGKMLHNPYGLNPLHLSLTLHVVLALKVNIHSERVDKMSLTTEDFYILILAKMFSKHKHTLYVILN